MQTYDLKTPDSGRWGGSVPDRLCALFNSHRRPRLEPVDNRARFALQKLADRDHLPHVFLRAGFTDRQALSFITFLAICLAGVGFAGEVYRVPEVVMFSLFLGGLSHARRLLVLFRKTYRPPEL
jgi:hypothetical protein